MKTKIIFKSVFLIPIISFVFSSCQRLDNNLYNTTDKLTSYELDNYTGEQDFILDASYKIPDSLITHFTLSSQGPNEQSPTTIHAIYIGDVSRIATDTVIMYSHGNKWHMDFYWQRAKLLANTGGKNRFGVLMIDFRGYGMSDGNPTEGALSWDLDAGLNWLRTNGLVNNRLVMYGFSMGSAPSTDLTAYPKSMTPCKLILEAPFASAAVLAADGAQLNMPASYFTNLQLNVAEEIKLVQQPYCWLHGLNDLYLNYQTHGQLVYDNYGGNYKEKHLVEGADHGEVPAKMGFVNYNSVLNSFITQH